MLLFLHMKKLRKWKGLASPLTGMDGPLRINVQILSEIQ